MTPAAKTALVQAMQAAKPAARLLEADIAAASDEDKSLVKRFARLLGFV